MSELKFSTHVSASAAICNRRLGRVSASPSVCRCLLRCYTFRGSSIKRTTRAPTALCRSRARLHFQWCNATETSDEQKRVDGDVEQEVSLWRHISVFSAVLLLAISPPSLAASQVVEGPARVVDGDTLEVAGTRVRLYGVDAPESRQACTGAAGNTFACGQASAAALREEIGQRPVKCAVKNNDQYGRSVASCSVQIGGGMEDVGSWLVSNGYAVAYREYSKDYIPVEERAREAHLGLWAGKFQVPSEWRREQKALTAPSITVAATPAASNTVSLGALPAATGQLLLPNNGCNIKGNINNKGEKIYHKPGNASYQATQIDLASGEKWFCSAEEAEKSGWRAAIR